MGVETRGGWIEIPVPITYYSLRQLNPYRGVVQVVDAGELRATTVDGQHWIVRQKNQYGKFTPVNRWSEGDYEKKPDFAQAEILGEALNTRPTSPFPMQDTLELWLLTHDTKLPLALMNSLPGWDEPPSDPGVPMPTWEAFAHGDTSFVAACMQNRERDWWVKDRGILEGQVNEAAYPYPVTQWFRRLPGGEGAGLGGLRVAPGMEGRNLDSSNFPELLVSENWPDSLERQLIREYHEWNAHLLLVHPNLKTETRRYLEKAACLRPERLMQTYCMIPQFVDKAALEVALVQAKLQVSAPQT